MIIDFENLGQLIIKKEHWKNILLGYAVTGHSCIPENTWIYTDNGLKQMSDLNNDAAIGTFKKFEKDVKVYNGINLEKPLAFYNNGVSDCKLIFTKSGYNLESSLNHKVDVLNNDGRIMRKLTKYLTTDDYLMVRKNQNIYGSKINLPSHWQVRQKLDVRVEIYDRPKVMTLKFARFLGYMVADGTLYRKGFNFCKRHKENVDDFSDLVFKLFGKTGNVKKHSKVNKYICEIRSCDIANFLLNIDGLKPNDKFIPQCILEAPKIYQCEFLKSLFEDGTVNLKKDRFDHIELSMKNFILNQQVRLILLNMGIKSTFAYLERDLYCLYIYKSHAHLYLNNISFISNFKNDRLQLCLNETKYISERDTIPYIDNIMANLLKKYNFKFSTYLINEKIKQGMRRGRITNQVLSLFLKETYDIMKDDSDFVYISNIQNNYFIEKIKSISDTVNHTYCLEMSDTHTFIQNGVQAGNSQGSEWDNVIVGIDYSAFMLLTCEWLYTAITRAKKYCSLVGENKAIRYAVTKSNIKDKKTHMNQLLK
jgi:hypothetical protein